MKIYQRHLAIRINWLVSQLRDAPKASISYQQRRGELKTIIKVWDKNGKMHSINAETPRGKELFPIAERNENYRLQLHELRREWIANYREPIPDWSRRLPVAKVRNALLTEKAYEEAIPYQNREYPLDQGLMYKNKIYRSKGEVKLATILDLIGLDFKYETTVEIGGIKYYPDFLVRQRETGRVIIIEYGGMLENQRYFDRLMNKKRTYASIGFLEGADVLYISEYSNSAMEEECIITAILSALEKDLVIAA